MTTCLFCDIVQGMQEIPLSEDLALQAKKFLQKTSFFSGWTDSELDEIMMHCQMNDFEGAGRGACGGVGVGARGGVGAGS